MTENKSENKPAPMKDFSIGVKESKKFEIPEIKDGVYDAVFQDMELKVNLPDGEGGTFDMLQWNFMVKDHEIHGKTSTIISTLSNAYKWITAISGKEPEINKDFKPAMIQGKKCQVIIKHKKTIREFKGEKQTQNMPYVDDVLSANK